jgi:hypothetical protein
MISIEITIDDEIKQYDFPTSWDEITLEKYKKLYSIPQSEDNNLMYSFDILNSLTGIDKDILYLMDLDDFKSLMDQLSFIYEPITSTNIDYVEINDEKYYLYTDYNKYTAGEIISIDTILKKHNNNYIQCMEELLCIFLRKKKEDKIERFTTDLFSRKSMFSQIKISEINNVFVFFLTGNNLSTNNTKVSLQKPNKKKKNPSSKRS